jgi:anti-sigma factor RsiW
MTQLPEMPCRELVEVITDYLEGALSAEDHQRFEEHLSACTACALYLEQFEVVIRSVGRITSEDQLGPELREGLVTAFRDWNG